MRTMCGVHCMKVVTPKAWYELAEELAGIG